MRRWSRYTERARHCAAAYPACVLTKTALVTGSSDLIEYVERVRR